MNNILPELYSSNVVKRYNGGEPILSKEQIPYPAECIFNAGVVKYKGRYIMAFRNDFDYISEGRFGGCVIGLAYSMDGIHWTVEREPFLRAEDLGDPDVTRIYDPRLTVIDEECYLCFAVDTKHGVRGGDCRYERF